MASTIVTIETGLQVVQALIGLIQTSQSTGQPIDAAAWAAATGSRDAALAKLDADIAAAGG